jgi:hypothetical protein
MFTEGELWTTEFTDWRLCFQIDPVLCFSTTRTGSVQSQCQYQLRSRSVITFLYCSGPTPPPLSPAATPSHCTFPFSSSHCWQYTGIKRVNSKMFRSCTECTQLAGQIFSTCWSSGGTLLDFLKFTITAIFVCSLQRLLPSRHAAYNANADRASGHRFSVKQECYIIPKGKGLIITKLQDREYCLLNVTFKAAGPRPMLRRVCVSNWDFFSVLNHSYIATRTSVLRFGINWFACSSGNLLSDCLLQAPREADSHSGGQ